MRGIELGKARTLEPCHQKKNRPSATLSGTAMVRETLTPIGAVLSESRSEELHDGCCTRVEFEGVAGSVVTRRDGSNSLGSALLVAAARPCKGLVLQQQRANRAA